MSRNAAALVPSRRHQERRTFVTWYSIAEIIAIALAPIRLSGENRNPVLKPFWTPAFAGVTAYL
jgi:hypothetical protein